MSSIIPLAGTERKEKNMKEEKSVGFLKPNDPDDFINESGLNFVDISTEQFRVYTWPNGSEVIINLPKKLNVAKSGGHRIFDAEEFSHYIPSGWIHLKWKVWNGCPNFVK
jgi:hypothetical protein